VKVYISGPMTGIEDFNYPAFHKAAALWRLMGAEVLNPADNFGGAVDLAYHKFMRADLEMLLQADAIALLPGWENSRGARYELLTAQMLNLKVFTAYGNAWHTNHQPEIVTLA
jgi:hypothetical protein